MLQRVCVRGHICEVKRTSAPETGAERRRLKRNRRKPEALTHAGQPRLEAEGKVPPRPSALPACRPSPRRSRSRPGQGLNQPRGPLCAEREPPAATSGPGADTEPREAARSPSELLAPSPPAGLLFPQLWLLGVQESSSVLQSFLAFHLTVFDHFDFGNCIQIIPANRSTVLTAHPYL